MRFLGEWADREQTEYKSNWAGWHREGNLAAYYELVPALGDQSIFR